MDLKTKLEKMVSDESKKLTAEEHRKRTFEGQQRSAFKQIQNSLAEIVEAAGPAVIKFYISESYAELRIKGSGSTVTKYEIEPNSIGRFSSAPSPAPGFIVTAETTYGNGLVYIEPTKREYILPSSDALLDDLMKQIAEAMASLKQSESGNQA